MNEKRDIETLLKQYRHEGGDRPKQAVLAAFQRRHGRKRPDASAASFWRRPVPLYAMVATLVILAAVSFLAGQRMTAWGGSAVEDAPPSRAFSPQDLPWSAAQNDLL